jgi:hypothetical protein
MLPIILCPKDCTSEWPNQGPKDDYLGALLWNPATSQSPKPSDLAPLNDVEKSTKDFLRKAFDRREEALAQLEKEAKDEFGDTLLPPDDTGREPSGQDKAHDCAKLFSTQ